MVEGGSRQPHHSLQQASAHCLLFLAFLPAQTHRLRGASLPAPKSEAWQYPCNSGKLTWHTRSDRA